MFTMCCVTKAMPIHFINSICHIKQLKSGKSHKNCLTNYTWSILYMVYIIHITPLVIKGLGSRRTHTCWHTKNNFKKPGKVPTCSWCAPGLKLIRIRFCFDVHVDYTSNGCMSQYTDCTLQS